MYRALDQQLALGRAAGIRANASFPCASPEARKNARNTKRENENERPLNLTVTRACATDPPGIPMTRPENHDGSTFGLSAA